MAAPECLRRVDCPDGKWFPFGNDSRSPNGARPHCQRATTYCGRPPRSSLRRSQIGIGSSGPLASGSGSLAPLSIEDTERVGYRKEDLSSVASQTGAAGEADGNERPLGRTEGAVARNCQGQANASGTRPHPKHGSWNNRKRASENTTLDLRHPVV